MQQISLQKGYFSDKQHNKRDLGILLCYNLDLNVHILNTIYSLNILLNETTMIQKSQKGMNNSWEFHGH